jgi:4'-phosphopantetheinyl transferase EntD
MRVVDCASTHRNVNSSLLQQLGTHTANAVGNVLCGLLPSSVRVAFDDQTVEPAPLFPTEQISVRNAVPSRQREFALGRHCARVALAEFGVHDATLPAGADRAPVWPAGFVGSITHCTGFVGAVVARSSELGGIGFDAEVSAPLSADIMRAVCTSRELEWIAGAGVLSPGEWGKIVFGAKEAIHKCIAPLSGRMLDFSDVTLTIDIGSAEFSASAATAEAEDVAELRAVRGRFAITDRLVFSCATMAPLARQTA